MSPIQFRPIELLRALVEAEVGFILVGGLAVNAWGHVRGTSDLDLVPNPDPRNLERLESLLVELDGRVVVRGRLLTAEAIERLAASARKAELQDLLDIEALEIAHSEPGDDEP